LLGVVGHGLSAWWRACIGPMGRPLSSAEAACWPSNSPVKALPMLPSRTVAE
jgi:hypothetical protein